MPLAQRENCAVQALWANGAPYELIKNSAIITWITNNSSQTHLSRQRVHLESGRIGVAKNYLSTICYNFRDDIIIDKHASKQTATGTNVLGCFL